MIRLRVATLFHAYKVTNSVNGKAYIGITTYSIPTRWRRHISTSKNANGGALHHAIRKYGAKVFHIEHVASARNWHDLCELERQIIVQEGTFLAGGRGYNATLGGEGQYGQIPTAEHRAKISAKAKGRIVTAETRLKMSKAGKGKKQSPEHVLARTGSSKREAPEIKQARLGSPEYRAVMALAYAKRSQCPKYLAALSLGTKDKPKSPEHRASIAVALRGKPHTAQRRANVSAALVGKPWSAARRASYARRRALNHSL